MQASSRLVLVTPEIGADSFAADLAAVVQATGFAAVIIRLAPSDERAQLARAKELVGIVQASGAAALLQGADDIVGRSGADGAHVLGPVKLIDAARRFRPEKMVGVGALKLRDDCMTAGESGADYLLFGDLDPDLDALLERVAWWAEIFEVPCTALAPTLGSVAQLVAAGADFVALGDVVWSAADPAAAAQEAVRAFEGVSA